MINMHIGLSVNPILKYVNICLDDGINGIQYDGINDDINAKYWIHEEQLYDLLFPLATLSEHFEEQGKYESGDSII